MSPHLDHLQAFLDRHADRLSETAWLASLAMIERACADAREGRWGRWRYNAAGELRRLRADLAVALDLARFAAETQEAENAVNRDLISDLNARVETEAAKRRSAAGRYAATIGALRRRAERAGLDPLAIELPSYADFLEP